MIWTRTGLVPAASCGDEVWWSESGYWLAHDGVLKWEIMNDDRGSGSRSFWPPVLPAIQAFFIQCLGLNSFSIYAQSSLHCTLLVLLVYLIGRQRGLSFHGAVLAGIGALGLFTVQRSFVQVRMESATALAMLAFLWLHGEASRRGRKEFDYLAGLALGIGAMAYYPLSPFLIVGALLTLALGGNFLGWWRVALGGLPMALVAGAWILPHWEDFILQVIDTGSQKYLSLGSFAHFIAGNLKTLSFRNLPKVPELLICGGLLIWKTLNHRSQDRSWVIFGWCMLAPLFLISPPQLLAAYLCVWVLVCGTPAQQPKLERVLGLVRVVLAALAFGQFGLISLTAVIQHEGRSYASVKEALDSIPLEGRGNAAISQRAWLGLRERARPDQLHLLVYSGPSQLNASEILKTEDAGVKFDILVLETDKIEILSRLYPWIGEGIRDGTFRQDQRIRPEFRPLPWARNPCYDLMVFTKTIPTP